MRFLLILAVVVVSAFSEYVCGRILLPEIGLEAPSFSIWLLISGIAIMTFTVIDLFKELIEE